MAEAWQAHRMERRPLSPRRTEPKQEQASCRVATSIRSSPRRVPLLHLRWLKSLTSAFVVCVLCLATAFALIRSTAPDWVTTKQAHGVPHTSSPQVDQYFPAVLVHV